MRRLAAAVAVLAALAGCTSVGRPPGEGLLRYRDRVFDEVAVTRDLEYGRAVNSEGEEEILRLDLYQPVGDTVTARPAVVWVHGGGFSGGSKSSGPSPALARTFAGLGYVAVSIDYRLNRSLRCFGSGSASNPDCTGAAMDAIDDAKAAVRWLRLYADTYGIDRDRIGIGGESAGAITAAGAGLTPEREGDSGNPGMWSAVGGWVAISGGLPGGALVDEGDPPGYLFTNAEDPIVPAAWSGETAAAMARVGAYVVLNTIEGSGHVPFREHRQLMETQSAYFFYGVLDLGDAAA